MSKIYCFRHAQASYLSDNYDQLSSLGEEQSRELGKYLLEKGIRFDRTFVGPLTRQKHTYSLVHDIFKGHQASFPDPTYVEELREHEGPRALKKALPNLRKSITQLQKWHEEMEADPTLLRKNSLLSFEYFISEWVDGKVHVPGIQSWQEFRTKVNKGLKTILKDTPPGKNIALFTSGGTIAAIAGQALRLENQRKIAALNFNVRNTSFSTFLYTKEKLSMLSFNEVPHLDEEQITFV